MRGRVLLLLFALVPGIVQAACSASNGDSIGGEVRDAEPLDAVSGGGGDRDSASGDGSNDSGSKDTGGSDAPKDSPSDAGPDAPSVNDVRINEVLFTMGSNNEYVELRGAPGTPLDTLVLRFVQNTSTIGPFTVGSPGAVMPADGLWVVGGALVSNVDQIHLITGPNGWDVPNGKGAVQLYVVGATTTIDVLGYWDVADASTGNAPPATDPKTTWEGKPATSPATNGPSLGRKTGAPDTNANNVDFCVMTATPGTANGTTCQ